MSTPPKRRKGRRIRAIDIRPHQKRFLIVCEGEKTEPNYFKSFRVNANVVISGQGKNTTSLITAAQKLQEEEGPFDAVWVVYDKDDFSPALFQEATMRAVDAGFRLAWSNQSFELWYLLHFQYLDAALHRSQYINCLAQHLPEGYRKNDPQIYAKLLSLQPVAIRNATRLVAFHAQHNNPPSSADPCTHVQDLVVELNAHLKE